MPLTSNEWLQLALFGAAILGFLLLRRRGGGLGSEELRELRKQGALVLDVRSPSEFQAGHIKGSLNIPVGDLRRRLAELDPARPVLTCCASGMRSGSARRILLKAGFQSVHNAGAWTTLRD